MKKPVFIRLLITVVIVIIIAVGIFLLTRKDLSSAPQQQVKTAEEKVPSQTTKTHIDEAGFQFDYPDDLTVVKKESASSAAYSSLEITSKEVVGSMTFLVEDTKVKSVNELIQKNIATKEAVLGSLKAIETTDGSKTTLLAIDQGIIFRLDLSSKEERQYWQSVYNTVLTSFSFVAPQAASDSSGSSGGEDVILEEEVIE